MKLSIIIVSYNEKEFLAEAVESCMHNDFEYEIIIGDDGSDDGSIELIQHYSNMYPSVVKYFVMDRSDIKEIIAPIRVSNIFKKAFEICKGEYVTVISADDINTVPDRYSKQVEFLDMNDKYYSCYVDYSKVWNNGERLDCSVITSLNENIFWATRYIHISCFVFRRVCLNNVLERFCDDTGLAFSILTTGKSKHMAINGFGYRQRDKSITHDVDQVGFKIMDIALFQDCLNYGTMKVCTIARFAKAFLYLRKNRSMISESKYGKYINYCSHYHNNVLQDIIDDNGSAKSMARKCHCWYWIFKLLRYANIAINLVFERKNNDKSNIFDDGEITAVN